MGARLPGLLLFLPVPFVLWVLTRVPLGPLPSLALGVALVATHGLYARPFALFRAQARCLYCGGPAPSGPRVHAREPFGETTWACCSEAHARPLQGVLAFSASHRLELRVGILGGTLLLLFAIALVPLHGLSPLEIGDVVATFRIVIACAVLPLSILGPRFPPSAGETPIVPFPLHIQALIGTLAVLWLFRIVGAVWLVLGIAHFAGRLLGRVP